MFSLLITLIALVLVGALAAIAIYYGGPAYSSAQLNAKVATLMSQGTQVKTAANAYAADNGGTVPTDVTQLTTSGPNGSYLTSVPSNPLAPAGAPANWSLTNNGTPVAYTSVQGICACEKFNEKYGYGSAAHCAEDTAAANIPSCAALTGTAVNSPICCQ